jgi:hypothetical protein
MHNHVGLEFYGNRYLCIRKLAVNPEPTTIISPAALAQNTCHVPAHEARARNTAIPRRLALAPKGENIQGACMVQGLIQGFHIMCSGQAGKRLKKIIR